MDAHICPNLHYGAHYGHPNCIRLLIAQGHEVNKKNSIGRIPLHDAVIKQRYECIVLLLELGANIYEKSDFGNTPYDLSNYRIKDIFDKYLEDSGVFIKSAID